MIDEDEFYRRLDEVVPGDSSAVHGNALIENDLYFERLSKSGLEEMHRYSTNEKLYEFFEFAPFKNIDQTKEYLEKLLQRMSADNLKRTGMYWFVRRRSDGYLIGTAALVDLNYGRKSIQWGYGVDPDLWGKGYILQIQECLKHYVFEVLQLNRLHSITMVENIRTISSVLSAGVQHEGTLRDFYCKNGVFHDGWQYGILRKDYLALTRGHSETVPQHNIKNVIEVISSVLSEETIDEDSSMLNTSNWDSLSHMTIMVALKKQLQLELSASQIAHARSVKAIVALMDNRSEGKHSVKCV